MFCLQHIDAIFHLIRVQVWNFPRTYGDKFISEDSILPKFYDGQYDKFKQKRNKRVLKFGEQFLDYVNDHKELFRRFWKDVNTVYYAMCLSTNHWVLCEIYFRSQDIKVYDSDKSLNSVEKFKVAIEPICHMLPGLLCESKFNPHKYKNLSTLALFIYKRLLPATIPQTKKR